MPNLTFETRSRFFSLQSQASRRERDFFSLNLEIRDKIENFQLKNYCEESLQMSGESESSVIVLGKCEIHIVCVCVDEGGKN